MSTGYMMSVLSITITDTSTNLRDHKSSALDWVNFFEKVYNGVLEMFFIVSGKHVLWKLIDSLKRRSPSRR